MAVDEAIALAFSKGMAPPTLRFYAWSYPSFSIGRFQRLTPDLAASLHERGIPIVRRPTGGQGVLHDQDITYSIVASTQDERFSGGLKGTFQTIARGLIAGLEMLGVRAEIQTPSATRRRGASPFCFDMASGYEITANGRKIIGSAQRRWAGYFLQHGSLTLQHRAWDGYSAPSPGASLATLLDPLPTPEEIAACLQAGMECALGITLDPGRLSEIERATALQIHDTATRAWQPI